MCVLSKSCARSHGRKCEGIGVCRDSETPRPTQWYLSRSHRFASFEVDSSTLRIKHGLIRRSSESESRALILGRTVVPVGAKASSSFVSSQHSTLIFRC